MLERPCPEYGFDPSSVPPESVAALLRANAASRERVLQQSDERVRRRPADDVCTLYHERLVLILREDDPLYPNWDQDVTAVEQRHDTQDPALVARQLLDAAAGLAVAFDGVRGEQWLRTGRRSDGARCSVAGFSRYLLHDPVHHLHDVMGH